jgi:hypothetical protein
MGKARDEPRRNDTADELTPKQEAAAVAMAGGATYEQAAEASGAAAPTIKTWAATVPAFRQRISALRAELSARVMGRITAGMCTAIDTLERLCASGKEGTQLKAAEALLTHGTALTEVAELKARMDEWERNR